MKKRILVLFIGLSLFVPAAFAGEVGQTKVEGRKITCSIMEKKLHDAEMQNSSGNSRISATNQNNVK